MNKVRTLTLLSVRGWDDPASPEVLGPGIVIGFRTGSQLVAFPGAGAALDAARHLQRAAHESGSVGLCMGVSAGDVGVGEELTAVPTLESLDLAAAAEPGQVLATEMVIRLAGAAARARPWAALKSPWRGASVQCFELDWSPAPSVAGWEVPLPVERSAGGWMPYVLRPEVAEVLEHSWARASTGRSQILLVEGEPGSGKSRLASEFAASIHERGNLVLWGSCTREAPLPSEPFAEGLHRLLLDLPIDDRRRFVGGDAADLDALLPRLALIGADPREPVVVEDAATRRYWAFEAVAALFERLSGDGPVLFVIDDLQWARPSTTALIDHLARSGRALPLCMLITVRNEAGELTDASRSFLAGIGRLSGVRRHSLGGLESDSLRDLAMLLTGHRLDARLEDLVENLGRLTDGNPFLFGELWRDCVRNGHLSHLHGQWAVIGGQAPARTPDSVREMIEDQVRNLQPPAPEVLRLGSLAGSEFEAELIAAASSVATVEALSALDQAVDAGLLVDTGPGRYRFRHDLLASAVASSQTSSQQCTGHHRIAAALQQLRPGALDRIAFHHARAVPATSQAVATEWALKASEVARQSSLYLDAAETLGSALEVTTDPGLRSDLLVALATVGAMSGDLDVSVASLEEAAVLAQSVSDPRRLVAAAICLNEIVWRSDGRVDRWPDVIDAALARADKRDRARLLGARSTVLTYTGQEEQALAAGDEAVAVARSVGDPALSARVMHAALFAGWRDPTGLEHRLELAMEATEMSRTSSDHEALLRNLMKQSFAHTAMGKGHALSSCVREMSGLANALRQPWLLAATAAFETVSAIAEGSLDVAAEALGRFETWSGKFPESSAGLGIMTFGLRREQGRLEEFRPFAEMIARLGQADRTWLPGLAALYSEVELLDEARQLLDAITADEGLVPPGDHSRLVALSYLADACAATGHTAAELVYQELAPWSRRCIWAPGLACYGAADRYLGKLAFTRGHLDDARSHLEAAVRLDTEAGWPTWAAHSRLALGELLISQPGTRDAGRTELETALRSAEVMQLSTVAVRAKRALTEIPASVAKGRTSVPLTTRELKILALVAVGRTNRQIGDALHTSRHTVANQVHSILTKTECSNRSAAAAWAIRHGLLEPD